ncbi:hypothetical protein [Paenibacillus sp. IITD108]|uniref:hypothetical protein n=1 Tax=Paenibacillus sp. IITD108 TaxID=3116649 RepID=UPI002F3F497B
MERVWKEYGKSMERVRKEYGKSMERVRKEYGKVRCCNEGWAGGCYDSDETYRRGHTFRYLP